MNLLFLCRIYPNYGGVEVVTTVLANKFVADGHHVVLAAFERGDSKMAEHLDPAVEVRHLKFPVWSAGNVRRLREIVLERNVDIIINQWGLPFFVTRLCRKATAGTGCRFVSVLHGAPDTSKVILKAEDRVRESGAVAKPLWRLALKLKERIVKWSIRYAVRHNSRYVLLSGRFVKPLAEYARLRDTSRIRSITNPITVPVTGFNLEEKKKQILYVGRMDYENKRVNRIIDLWDSLYRAYPDWELVLVGDGPHKATLQATVRQRDIPRVRFENFRKEPPIPFYRDASVFLLTSDLEGWGLVLVECMSYGVVPVVYGSYEAVYDIIGDGVTGFITPKPYDRQYTAARLRTLLDDTWLRRRMAMRAAGSAGRFDLESTAARWYSLFDEITRE